MNESRQLTVGSLFAGIGGFDLGLERAGMRVIWQSEIDPYACAVLRKHWPTVPNLGDIRGITAASVADAEGWEPDSSNNICRRQSDLGNGRPDVLCGGFPCQDISNAGKRAGIDGERSGLWSEFARVIGELRPRYVIVENVAALLGRGIERVLGDLAALGFDAEWHCIPASAVGAPHRRDRVWIIARQREVLSHTEQFKRDRWRQQRPGGIGEAASVAYTASQSPNGYSSRENAQYAMSRISGNDVADADEQPARWLAISWGEFSQWIVEPDVGRVAHGIPPELDGDLNAQKLNPQEGAAGYTGRDGLSELRSDRENGSAPSRLFTPGSFRDFVRALSHQSGLEGWHAQDATDEELQGLRQGVRAEPQYQAQHLQQGMLVGDRQDQRDETLGPWTVEPAIPRVAHGIPKRVDRLRCLGNAIVPQIAEIIGRAIIESEL